MPYFLWLIWLLGAIVKLVIYVSTTRYHKDRTRWKFYHSTFCSFLFQSQNMQDNPNGCTQKRRWKIPEHWKFYDGNPEFSDRTTPKRPLNKDHNQYHQKCSNRWVQNITGFWCWEDNIQFSSPRSTRKNFSNWTTNSLECVEEKGNPFSLMYPISFEAFVVP